MKFLFSSVILAATALASTPCTNGIDGSITGQYVGWTCQQLGHLLLGPGEGYCTIADLEVACCACGGGGTAPSNPTPNPTSAPQPTPTPTSPAAPTADPTSPAVPTAEPTNPSGDCQPLWGQCGGAEWSGPTCCQSGVCTTQSIHYSQCSPSSNPSTPTPNPTSPVTPSPTQPVVTPNPTNPTVPTPQPTNPTSQPTDPTPVTPQPTNAPATPTPQPTPGDHSSSASDSWNVCYFTNWARYRNGLINEGKDVFEMGFDADMCTHFMYGFMKVSQDYDIVSSDPNADHPSGHMGQNELCNEACNDPNFKTDWSDPNGERCDWPCNPTRTMRGYEAMNVGMKAKNPNLKTLISVGGWNFNDCAASPADTVGQGSATCEIFSTIAKDENKIRVFAANIIRFARAWGFDGFDLDWEYPVVAGHNSNHKVDGKFVDEIADYANYITMLRVLKEEFAKEQLAPGHSTLLLTAAVGVGKGTVETAYNIPEMSKYLDQINLMTYDMHGGWESRTGCNAPLYATDEDVAFGGAVGAGVATEGYPLSVSWAVDYWLAHGAKPEQLTMGVGTYGRGWKLDDINNNGYNAPASSKSAPGSATGEAGYLAYYEIMDLLANNQATRHYDSDRECPYIITTSGEWIGYDDKVSMKKKMDFLKSRNIRGSMVWALDLDDFNGSYHNGEKYPIINFIRDELRDYDPSVAHHSRRLQG